MDKQFNNRNKMFKHKIYVTKNINTSGMLITYWKKPNDYNTNPDDYVSLIMSFKYLDCTIENIIELYAIIINNQVIKLSQTMFEIDSNNSTIVNLTVKNDINERKFNRRKYKDSQKMFKNRKNNYITNNVQNKLYNNEYNLYDASVYRRLPNVSIEVIKNITRLERSLFNTIGIALDLQYNYENVKISYDNDMKKIHELAKKHNIDINNCRIPRININKLFTNNDEYNTDSLYTNDCINTNCYSDCIYCNNYNNIDNNDIDNNNIDNNNIDNNDNDNNDCEEFTIKQYLRPTSPTIEDNDTTS